MWNSPMWLAEELVPTKEEEKNSGRIQHEKADKRIQ